MNAFVKLEMLWRIVPIFMIRKCPLVLVFTSLVMLDLYAQLRYYALCLSAAYLTERAIGFTSALF